MDFITETETIALCHLFYFNFFSLAIYATHVLLYYTTYVYNYANGDGYVHLYIDSHLASYSQAP